MPDLHTYASVRELRAYLSGESDGADWTKESSTLRTLVESASRRITEHFSGNWFGPVTATREYDLGSGALRNDSLLRSRAAFQFPDYWPSKLAGKGYIALEKWLISATTVTAYSDTARTTNTVLTSGIGNDYLLEPYNDTPKRYLKLEEDTSNTLYGGQKTLTILGSWGWQDSSRIATTLAESINDSVTDPQLTDALNVSPGQVILIGTEQMYVREVNGPDAIVERGHNGTTAASHTSGDNVSVYNYPGDVVEGCLSIARAMWADRHAGTTEFVGSGEASMTRPRFDIREVLRGLSYYRAQLEHGGMYF